jgi:hypothetical protein
VVGAIPAGLPVPRLPDVHPHDLRELLLPAFSVLIVGFSDDVLTARSFARRGEEIRPNQELLALCAANVGSSLLRGFPVSSSATRTSIGIAAGSRTQLYSLTAAASALAVLLFLRPVLSRFPTAALGAIVIYYPDAQTIPGLVVYRRGQLTPEFLDAGPAPRALPGRLLARRPRRVRDRRRQADRARVVRHRRC